MPEGLLSRFSIGSEMFVKALTGFSSFSKFLKCLMRVNKVVQGFTGFHRVQEESFLVLVDSVRFYKVRYRVSQRPRIFFQVQ